MWIIQLWFYTIAAFVAVMHAKKVVQEDGLSLFWKVNLYPIAGVGFVLDWWFNWVFGTIMFAEVPHEFLFTSRCQRHKEGFKSGFRMALANWWCDRLNEFDPGHC